MSALENSQSNAPLRPSQQAMVELWEEHLKDEFELRNVEKTLETMVDHPYNTVVPTLTGGIGRDGVREFYTKWFIPQNPRDTETTLVSRTIGDDQLIDEMIFKFTHTSQMDWMLPGIAPTGKRVQVPLIVFVGFRDGKITFERVYWDQAKYNQITFCACDTVSTCTVVQWGMSINRLVAQA